MGSGGGEWGSHGSVATAQLGPLTARLRQLSRLCGSGSEAEPISMASERLSHPKIACVSWRLTRVFLSRLAASPALLSLPSFHLTYLT